jgi:hypothetical protein
MITEQYLKILEVMNNLKGDGQPFSDVFSWPDPMPKTFPIAIVNIDRGAQRDESTNIKVLTNNFTVRCVFRQQNASAAYLQRAQVTDLVLQEFTKKPYADYLDDTATKMDISHEFFVTMEADQPIFGVDIFIVTECLMEVGV